MLDVHPPEHTPHTWRDFAIHIPTIVVGLLIAIGLEQSVEWIHHRGEIREAREHIHDEIEVNERICKLDQKQTAIILEHLSSGAAILHAKPGQPLANEPLDFSWNLQGYYDAAYNSAKDTGTLNRLPYQETAMYADAYMQAKATTDNMFDMIRSLNAAKGILHSRTLAELSPTEIPALETAINSAIGTASFMQTNIRISQEEWDAVLSGKYRNDIGGTEK